MLTREQRAVLAGALATPADRHRRLMTLLIARPGAHDRQIGAALAMPVGSIGSIRARSLARLERHPALRNLQEVA